MHYKRVALAGGPFSFQGVSMKTPSLFAAAFALLAALPTHGFAADAKGDFAVRGAGRLACSELVDALETKDQRLTIFATWLEGYVTAANQFSDATFDSAPWQTTELLIALAGRSCAARANANVMDVVGRLIAEMRPLRLRERSPLVKIARPDEAQVHYRETVERVRARLIELGYEFETTSIIGEKPQNEMEAHLLDFQKQNGLPPSGRLDQHTLLNLFVRPSE